MEGSVMETSVLASVVGLALGLQVVGVGNGKTLLVLVSLCPEPLLRAWLVYSCLKEGCQILRAELWELAPFDHLL
jgi:hypothetical protein